MLVSLPFGREPPRANPLFQEQDPRTRIEQFDESLALLNASLKTHPTPSTHHHLALAYLRPGETQNLETAILHARAAVEGDHGEARHWHLLGLLLTASGEWRAAKEVLEMGISVGDADVVDDEVDSVSANGHASANGTSPPDFSGASSPRINGRAELEEPVSPRDPVRLLEPGWTEVPSSASLLQPHVDRPWPSRQEAFEHALQLRMSQLTLSEFVEGPESTGDKWVEVFQWFSERRSMVADDRTCILHS